MKKLGLILLLFLMVSLSVLAKEINIPKNFVLVEGDGNKIKDFYICKYEVTQGEYEELMGYNQSYFEGKNLPVESVTWYDAIMYCNKLSEKENISKYYKITNVIEDGYNIKSANISIIGGKGFKLLEDKEWEYAAKGGKKSKGYKYSGSNNVFEVAWVPDNCGTETHPVGEKKANELGIYDMSGNVSEWTNTKAVFKIYTYGSSWQESYDGYILADPGLRSLEQGFRVGRLK